MDKQKIEIVVLSILASILKCDVSEDSSRENHPQWDSLKHIEIIFAIEDELNIQFSEDSLPNLNSVQRIVDGAMVLSNEA